MPKKLSTLAVGALVKDAASLYYGKPIVWKVADKNHADYPSGAVTLIAEKILCLKCFDAKEANNSDNNRKNYGNNRYTQSNIDRWLNSASGAGSWWAATHSADAAPTHDTVWGGWNEYQQEAGFLYGFSANMRNALLSTRLLTVKNTVTDSGGSESITRKIFLASTTEVGLANENNIAEGSKLALFSDDASRLAQITPECLANSEYKTAQDSNLAVGKPWIWWLRTPYASDSYNARYVNLSGALNTGNAYYGYWGVRPLCNLSSEILVSDSTDSDGAYTIVWNRAPTVPPSLTYPESVRGGGTIAISWGASTDEDNNLSGYILERSVNGGGYTQLYKGINRSYTDSVTFGWNTVQYRVKAYDSAGAESAYFTGGSRTVTNNHPPTISGADSDLGTKTGTFSQNYSVHDEDAGNTVTVVEKIDGVQKRSFKATLGDQYTFNVTQAEWVPLLNGAHTLTVTATDNYGGTATRTFTFHKNETEIEFRLTDPLPADDMLTKAIMSVTREIPVGAAFTVEVCNNGNDPEPTWEDVTNAVLGNSKFFFDNTTKTAAAWGFNFRIRVQRKNATGDCFIQSVGGNFE